MEIALDSGLNQRLGHIFGLKSGATELALATADREQLGAALLRSLENEPLLSPSDIHRIVPRRTWLRRRAEARLSRDEFDGLYRLVRTQTLAELVFGDAERARSAAQPQRAPGRPGPHGLRDPQAGLRGGAKLAARDRPRLIRLRATRSDLGCA